MYYMQYMHSYMYFKPVLPFVDGSRSSLYDVSSLLVRLLSIDKFNIL